MSINKFERATKSVYRFHEKKSGTLFIGMLYSKKSVFGSSESENIKATAEWE